MNIFSNECIKRKIFHLETTRCDSCNNFRSNGHTCFSVGRGGHDKEEVDFIWRRYLDEALECLYRGGILYRDQTAFHQIPQDLITFESIFTLTGSRLFKTS